MAATEHERGKLLLAVRIHSTPWLIWGWALIGAWAAVVLTQIIVDHKASGLVLIGAIAPLAIQLVHPRIRFFENGVELPIQGESDKRPLRFIPWRQIERYSRDADMLTVAGTQSVLFGGPVEGGRMRISSSNRQRGPTWGSSRN